MSKLNDSARLKVKRDTFFLPDPNGGVYFRNNSSSFRMKGKTIYQWIEKLMPMFNGEHTLGELTKGLSAPYRNRVYEIAEILYRNGFVRDVNQDRPHQLDSKILKKYASQIEFIESFVDSGAFRFQVYRQSKVLAVGSGPFLVSLVSALIESGLPKFHVLITDSMPTNRQRLKELAEHARKTDSEVAIEEISLHRGAGESSWREVVQPFEWILYVSQEGNVEELRALHAVCREEKKGFLPAISLQQVGLAGPLVHPDSEGCWESAWRRIHRSVLREDRLVQAFSATAGAMLANVIVFELFKKVTGVTKSEQRNQFFLLDLETLEGDWHSFIPHPLATTERVTAELIQDLDSRLKQNASRDDSSRLFHYFSQLTSAESGIFHIWEERNLNQLPLSQCCVQAVNPLSEGPAELLPEVVCAGLTHEEARREAGLAGIESYVSGMIDLLVNTEKEVGVVTPQEFIGVGAGETMAEGVCRGLQKCLDEELSKRQVNRREPIFQVRLGAVEDEHCRFYLQSLATMHGSPTIGLGEKVSGFPVVWVGTGGRWYGSAGLNITMALRKALEQAIMDAQNQATSFQIQALEESSIFLNEEKPLRLEIPACEETTQSELLQSAMQVLEQNRMRLFVFDLAIEPFLKEELAGVFGVLLRKEDF
ncbi:MULTISPECIES: putative thiazole-containing bacteriocin maturation protein [unclassified Geobacillus]|uniref:putative thiazole-containing bacteriocin maturation protein n=1 Tax=unclassified Geobacillus TaxID=2642459 RepID=UPI000BE3C373|nr:MULTISPECIES: putative thiazole-containing bacteriocin maturation protein [unclassified Geobacillus]PDM39806.1 putative thiazole-containing bacteriocin maturation protein [Parageobacillus yumthangensis]PUF88417.1 putative thiazole-containing bacteriocin maturation protein [Geobacillus sp. LYN3]TXK86879.1 putative thiazole-containing bacteriocin maturation protein [Geobacillus sp. AYS3]